MPGRGNAERAQLREEALRISDAGDGMDYLALKLVWWLLAAFALGFVVGWLSCGPQKQQARRPEA